MASYTNIISSVWNDDFFEQSFNRKGAKTAVAVFTLCVPFLAAMPQTQMSIFNFTSSI